jgi:hypothetical protein
MSKYARIARLFLALGLLTTAPAYAQYSPRPTTSGAVGENFHIEGGVSIWSPSADVTVASSGTGALAGIIGTTIDAKQDLGLVDQRLKEFQVMVRPAPAHKFRFQYIPIDYEASSTLNRTIDFNGQRYQVGLPVNTSLQWNTYRFGYEFDFLRRNSGFAGFIAEAKFTDAKVSLNSPVISEFTEIRGPIPAIGGIGRYYFVPNFAITGELTLLKVPTIADRYSGHYVDVDIYGTLNFTNNFGVQGGYRSIDLGLLVKQDSGTLTLSGIYFGVVARY